MWGTETFGTSPMLVQLSDKPLLATTFLFGVPARKAQWLIDELHFDPIR